MVGYGGFCGDAEEDWRAINNAIIQLTKQLLLWNLSFSLLNYGKKISQKKDGLNFMNFLDYRVFNFSNKTV